MARVLSLSSEALPYRLEQAVLREAVSQWLCPSVGVSQKLVEAWDHGGIQSRFSVIPFEDVFYPQPFTERNRVYGEVMIEFGTKAVTRALAEGDWPPERVHTFITVSCTGVMIPSPDVHIINRLKLLPEVRRIPVTELGCVGGAVAVARGAEIVDAHQRSRTVLGRLAQADLAIILAAEFPSLNFQYEDLSPANVISSSLFGDGVVAMVLGPDETVAGSSPRPSGPRVIAARSHLVPDSSSLLGYDLRGSGFHIVLSREVPLLLRSILGDLMGAFLEDLGWLKEDVKHWVVHPGGEKILQVFLDTLGLSPESGAASREVLRDRGNASSAAVLLVLERVGREASPGDRGVLMAFGPGFSTELVALEW